MSSAFVFYFGVGSKSKVQNYYKEKNSNYNSNLLKTLYIYSIKMVTSNHHPE